jgi:hypothetical protein
MHEQETKGRRTGRTDAEVRSIWKQEHRGRRGQRPARAYPLKRVRLHSRFARASDNGHTRQEQRVFALVVRQARHYHLELL